MSGEHSLPYLLPVNPDNKHVFYELGPDASSDDYLVPPTMEELGVFVDLKERGSFHWEYVHIYGEKENSNMPQVFLAYLATNPLNPNGINPRVVMSVTMPPVIQDDGSVVAGERIQEIVHCDPKQFEATREGLNITMSPDCYIRTTSGEYKEGNPIDLEISFKGKNLELNVESIGKIRPAKGGTGGTTYGDDQTKLNWIQKQTRSEVNGSMTVRSETIPIENAIGHVDSGSGTSPEAIRKENNWDWSVLRFGPYDVVESTATSAKDSGHESRKRIILAHDDEVIAEDPRNYQPFKDYEEPLPGRDDNLYSRTLYGRYFLGERDMFEWETRTEYPLLVKADLLSLVEDNPLLNTIVGFLNNSGIFYTGRYDRFYVKGVLRHFKINDAGEMQLVEWYEGDGVRERFLPGRQMQK